MDYLKLDGVGAGDIPDVQAWSAALAQTGRPIHLELSNSLAIADASTWAQYSNGWRTGGDIECYGCETSGTSYPLTDWANIESRFNQVAQWQPYGGPGAFNDYDSLEIRNITVPLQLSSGANTIEFADPSAYTPDFDRIIVAGNPN